MYGMPSRVRLLYHGLGQREAKTIDRDLDLAITEFAPGSQKTKDKRVYTAIGFTAPLLPEPTWRPSSPNPFPRRLWMMRCDLCHYAETSPAEPANTFCPECGNSMVGDNAFRVFEIVVPAAFRTALNRGVDAKEGAELLPRGMSSLAERSDIPLELVNGTNTRRSLSSGVVYKINDRAGRLFSGSLGMASWVRGGRALPDQWIEERYQNQRDEDDAVRFTPNANGSERIALAAPKTTDILRIQPASVTRAICLDLLARDENGHISQFGHGSDTKVRGSWPI